MSDYKLDKLTELDYRISELKKELERTVDKTQKRKLKHRISQLKYLRNKEWFKGHEQQPTARERNPTAHDYSGFAEDIGKLNRIMSGEDEQIEQAKEQLKRDFNAYQEREATKNLCPKCRTYPCICHEEGD